MSWHDSGFNKRMAEQEVFSLTKKVERLEKAEILEALRKNKWVKAKAARTLGITERMIGYKIKKYGLEKEVRRHFLGAIYKGSLQ